jgi:hypothetical protein
MLIQNGAYSSHIKSVSQTEATPPEQGTPTTTPKTGVAATSDTFENQKQVATAYDKPTSEPTAEPPADADAIVNPSDLTQFFGEFGNERTGSAGSLTRNAILNDPSLPLEEKMALFLFDFMEKEGKNLLSIMEQLDKSKQKSTGSAKSNQPTPGQGAVSGNQATEGAAGANGQPAESEQITLEKLKLAHDKMTKMFSIVDNILTSNTRAVKEGPIAGLKG